MFGGSTTCSACSAALSFPLGVLLGLQMNPKPYLLGLQNSRCKALAVCPKVRRPILEVRMLRTIICWPIPAAPALYGNPIWCVRLRTGYLIKIDTKWLAVDMS